MAIQPQLLEILACPICKEEVRPVPLSEARRATVRDKFRDKMRGEELVVEDGLQCVKCHRVCPIVSDIPVMLVDEAFLARRLGIPEETPRPVVFAVFFYIGHLFCQGWVASSECFAFLTMATVGYCLYRRLLTPSFHILYVPLAMYGLVSTLSALFAERRIHSFGEIALWGKILLFPTALILLRNVPLSRYTAMTWFYIFGIFTAAYGLGQYIARFGHHDLEHRITGQSAHVMTLSGLLLPASLIFLVIWIHNMRSIVPMIGLVMTHIALLLTLMLGYGVWWWRRGSGDPGPVRSCPCRPGRRPCRRRRGRRSASRRLDFSAA